MNFTEPSFALLLAVVLVGLAAARRFERAQVLILLVASWTFYAWWEPRFLLLLVASSLTDFFLAARIAASKSERMRKALIVFSLVANLGLVGLFKYADFFMSSANAVFGTAWPLLGLTLPVGISFYTFQSLSYTLDVYRREIPAEPQATRFLAFVAAFPQLVAGPIVRASTFLPQLHGPFFQRAHAGGLFLVIFGLAKKLLLADPLGALVVDPVFANPADHGAVTTLAAVYAYTFQIFLDFSAYSDMAIGIGALLGLEFPENFRAPYLARSLGEFWRRWHISLSTWFRDYLYGPLGGSSGTAWRSARNLMIVFVLSGLWHGARWTFVAWGALHGLGLIAERVLKRRLTVPPAVAWLLTFHVVALGWVLFRAETFTKALTVLGRIFMGADGAIDLAVLALPLLVIAAVLHLRIEPKLSEVSAVFARLPAIMQAAAAMVVFSAVYVVAEAEIARRAFIYFQF